MSWLCTYMYTTCVPGASRGQKRALELLTLEFLMAEDRICVLPKSSQQSLQPSDLSRPANSFPAAPGSGERIRTSLEHCSSDIHLRSRSVGPNSLCYSQARTCCTGATPRAGGSGEEPGRVAGWQPDPLHLSLSAAPLAPPPERPPRERRVLARAPRRGSSSGACALRRPHPPPPTRRCRVMPSM